MTAHALKVAAGAAYAAVLAVAFWRAERARGGKIGLHDPLPRWLVAVVLVATVGVTVAVAAANLFGRR